MIFVTVGGQMPFDRLVRAMDTWAASRSEREVFAQIGTTELVPRAFEWVPLLTPSEFRQRARQAELIVSHAGMGTILTALDVGTPILVMPRRAHLRETRSDHQVATMKELSTRKSVIPAADEAALVRQLDSLNTTVRGAPAPVASTELLTAIRDFIAASGSR